jgi:hypothetical protein
MPKLALIIFSFCLLATAFGQNLDKGIYISHRGGIIPKYAILTVHEDSAQLEVFTKWQGEWLPAIGSWDNTYEPQMLNKNENGSLSNENVVIHRKKQIMGLIKNTFVGRLKFKFNPVEVLPEKYEEVRQKGLEFTKRKN